MRTFAVLTRTELALLLREPAALFFTFALPLLLLSLNGGVGNEPQAAFGGVGLLDVMVPGYLLLVMCTSGLMALPETLASYRERGFLRRLRVSPMRPWQIVGAHAATHLLVAGVGLALLMALGVVAFGLNPPASWPVTILAVTASATAVVALGFALASILPTVRTTQSVAAALYFPSIFISGAVMPVEELPGLAQRLSDWIPFTYGVRAIREAWASGAVDGRALGVLAVTALIAVIAGTRTFRWEARY